MTNVLCNCLHHQEADCDKSTLPGVYGQGNTIKVWAGYETSTLPDVILSGQSIAYSCSQTQYMLPVGSEAWDPESNGLLEVTCIDGVFEKPQGVSGDPPSCVESSSIICNSRPEPPTNSELEHVDTGKNKYRPGEKAYYVCKNNASIIQPNGTNVFDIACQEGVYNFNTDLANEIGWPNCTVEPICDNLPDPPESTHMIRATKGSTVRLGEHVVYECAQKDKYWETPAAVRNKYV